MVMPGDNASVTVGLDKPVALEPGSHFAVPEGGKTVGSGVVSEVVARVGTDSSVLSGR
jgi:elongation factor Tu